MLLGVMADTHDRLPFIDRAVEIMNRERVELVVHAGDYIAPFTVKHFKPLNVKLLGVFGNNDAELSTLSRKFADLGFDVKGRFRELKLDGLRIAVLHGDEEELLESLVRCGGYNVVIHGHTHKAEVRKVGGTLVLNPGEVCGYLSGEPTVAKLDTKTLKVEVMRI
ncbi:hypothetical protein DRO55_01120 [Candidatus Bathyarchaeota archaeon]|nr:MAG: hypothetical protein DRO55_01120 [Candidatus Bathyarchaeota archaeon]